MVWLETACNKYTHMHHKMYVLVKIVDDVQLLLVDRSQAHCLEVNGRGTYDQLMELLWTQHSLAVCFLLCCSGHCIEAVTNLPSQPDMVLTCDID